MWLDRDRTAAEIARFSAADAARLPAHAGRLRRGEVDLQRLAVHPGRLRPLGGRAAGRAPARPGVAAAARPVGVGHHQARVQQPPRPGVHALDGLPDEPGRRRAGLRPPGLLADLRPAAAQLVDPAGRVGPPDRGADRLPGKPRRHRAVRQARHPAGARWRPLRRAWRPPTASSTWRAPPCCPRSTSPSCGTWPRPTRGRRSSTTGSTPTTLGVPGFGVYLAPALRRSSRRRRPGHRRLGRDRGLAGRRRAGSGRTCGPAGSCPECRGCWSPRRRWWTRPRPGRPPHGQGAEPPGLRAAAACRTGTWSRHEHARRQLATCAPSRPASPTT